MLSKSIAVTDFSTAGTIYTVPPRTRTKWVLAFASNTTGSTVSSVSITWNNGVSVPIVGSKSLNSSDFLLFGDGNYVMLEAGDTVSVSAGASGVSGVFTFEETSGTVNYG